MKQQAQVWIGQQAQQLGQVSYVKDGAREYSAFAYDGAWLAATARFEVSPDLALIPGYQVRRSPSRDDSVFHHALADTEPDAWGRCVIARAHARARKLDAKLPALTAFDYLLAVDDFSRVGALPLRDDTGRFLGDLSERGRHTLLLLDLHRALGASRAVEAGSETAEDLNYLQGRGTSLGGMRPKCTLLDNDGTLALGKFPSLHDQRQVERGEVLAMRLAHEAGIDTAQARIALVNGTPVAVIKRFDRTPGGARIPYLSAASMLQASRQEDRSYAELADIVRARCADPVADLRQLWRRLVFNLLITNVDDHLQNLGFLHLGGGQWRLAPAFDLNPFPDKDRESKTWLSEALGPITSLDMLLAQAAYFKLSPAEAQVVVAEVHRSVQGWLAMSRSAEVGFTALDQEDFGPAFEHAEMQAARAMLS